MTGWTQFTARFENERHADALVEDAEASPHRITYNESYGDIARVRILGYNNHGAALSMLRHAGPFESAIIADFNDTSDSGVANAFSDGNDRLHQVGEQHCGTGERFSFEYEHDGLVETGSRAGQDFSLEEKYGDESDDDPEQELEDDFFNSVLINYGYVDTDKWDVVEIDPDNEQIIFERTE